MSNTKIYKRLLSLLTDNLELLPDKPEETYDASLKALWQLAAGNAVSAELAVQMELTDLDSKQEEYLERLVKRRLEGVPLAYITGRQQFMGIELITNAKALIPRKETELLGDTALKKLKELADDSNGTATVFDICCGAGNLGIALAVYEPRSRIFAADLSEDAVNLAKQNVRFHNLEERIIVYAGDLLSPFESEKFYKKVNLIVCNPPYISDFKVPKMAREISQYEPEMAFKGGGLLGMNIVQNLINNAVRFLTGNGIVLFEIGVGQGDYVMNLCKKSGLYRKIFSESDEQGNIRVVGAIK